MKKRVRVYQKGGFNAFGAPAMPPLRVAQEGANVQQPQYSDEQLLSVVMSIVGEQGGSPEDAMHACIHEYAEYGHNYHPETCENHKVESLWCETCGDSDYYCDSCDYFEGHL